MPQVPIPQVADSTQSTPRVTGPQGVVPVQNVAGQQIQQAGAALSNLGEHTTAIAVKMNEDHAIATANSGLNEWTDRADGISHGYRAKVGRDAVDFEGKRVESGVASGKAAEQIEAEMRSVEAGMSSDLAKRVFREAAERRMVSIRSRLHAHEADQTKAYVYGEHVAAVERHTNNYILDPDPEEFASAIGHIREISSDAGHGKEQRDAFILKARTSLHAGRVAQLLSEEDAKGADAYLRSQEKDQIDVSVRGKLRSQIDGVLKAQGTRKLGVDLVLHHGYESHEARVRSMAAALPKARQDQIAKTALLQIGKDMGISEKDLAVPGAWEMLKSNPEAMSRLSDQILTLDDEIIRARYAGMPAATDPNTGTYGRAMETLEKMYRDGKIDSERYLGAQRTVDELISRQVKVKSVETHEALLETERLFENNRVTGTGPLSVDSPLFATEHPDLWATLRDNGALDTARGLTPQRANDPHYYAQLYADFESGDLARMSMPELRNKYELRLGTTEWKEALRKWGTARGETAGIADDPITKWETALKLHLGSIDKLTGKLDINGIPKFKNDTEAEYWVALQRDLNEALKRGEGPKNIEELKKWVNARELDKVWTIGSDSRIPWWVSPAGAFQEWLYTAPARSEVPRYTMAPGEAHTVKVGGQHINMAGGRAMGPKGDPIPVRASEYIRDWWRIDQIKERMTPVQGEAFEKEMATYAGANPSAPRNHVMLETIFREAGLGEAWPPAAHQVTMWNELRNR